MTQALIKKQFPAVISREATDLNSLDKVLTLGDVLAQSGYFQDAKEAAQVVVKVLAGAELGFGPVASMTGVYLVNGKVSLSANLIAAAVKRSGKYNYRVREHTEQACELEFFEQGESVGTSRFTMKEAQAAKLDMKFDSRSGKWEPKPTWKNFPKNMLFARAMSNGAKWFCPDIFGGPVYTPDEIGMQEDEGGSAVIETVAERLHPEATEDPALLDARLELEIKDIWKQKGMQETGLNPWIAEKYREKGYTGLHNLTTGEKAALLEKFKSRMAKTKEEVAPPAAEQVTEPRQEQPAVAPAQVSGKPRYPGDPQAKGRSDLISHRLLGEIKAMGREQRRDVMAEAKEIFSFPLEEISTDAAKWFVKYLEGSLKAEAVNV